MTDRLHLGIDVGTGSARAGLFDREGRMVGTGSHRIAMNRPLDDFVEQSSDDIWAACGQATRAALAQASASGRHVASIGFDATCSLVLLDSVGRPVTVSPGGDDRWNVIVWMDHRAVAEARRINEMRHDVLRYVGGVISPEMECPKLLWLKEQLPSSFARAAHFLDLADYLTFQATGSDVRSLCTVVCKWTYRADSGWDTGFLNAIGLGDFPAEGFRRIGRSVRPMGERAGGLTESAAGVLGLLPGTPVAVSIIDAHAGGLGLLGAPLDGRAPNEETLEERVALIGGTSTCHMAVSRAPKFIPGVWGPYESAMIPGLYLTEGGQSATGALIDHTIASHARGAELAAEARRAGTTPQALLNQKLDVLAANGGVAFPAELTRDLHVLPDHHGNRSPRADPSLRGMVSGLKLTDSVDHLALLYLATIQAIALGTAHILEVMNAHGFRIRTIFASGGDTKNPVFVREHADATGCRVVLPAQPEAVLLGAAILGAVASGDQPSVLAAMAAMNRAGSIVEPNTGAAQRYHAAKYRVFQRMHDDQLAYRALMREA